MKLALFLTFATCEQFTSIRRIPRRKIARMNCNFSITDIARLFPVKARTVFSSAKKVILLL